MLPSLRLLPTKVLISGVIILSAITILLSILLERRVPRSTSLSPPEITSTPTLPSSSVKMPVKRVMYATFAKDLTAEVFLLSTATLSNTKVASLPLQVKNITPVDDTTILYLRPLDPFDRGEAIYELARGGEKQLITAEPGFVFDRFSLSPDKQRLVIWEVSDSPFLAGAGSKILVVSRNEPTARALISSEVAGDLTKYPIGWLGNDTLIIDTFSTTGSGFFRGLSLINVNSKSESKILAEGEYSSLPTLAPDGSRFALTAYTPNARIQLPPLISDIGLSRVALRNPNKIIEYDHNKGTTAVILQNLDGELFETLAYSPDSSQIAYHSRTIATAENQQVRSAIRTVNRLTQQITPLDDDGSGAVVGWLDEDDLLIAKRTAIATPLGGILSPYSQIVEGLYILSLKEKMYTKFLSDKPLQILGIL